MASRGTATVGGCPGMPREWRAGAIVSLLYFFVPVDDDNEKLCFRGSVVLAVRAYGVITLLTCAAIAKVEGGNRQQVHVNTVLAMARRPSPPSAVVTIHGCYNCGRVTMIQMWADVSVASSPMLEHGDLTPRCALRLPACNAVYAFHVHRQRRGVVATPVVTAW